MKAFLLAAGIGSRLRPLTDTVPKCLLPIGGTPLLDIWLRALGLAGVTEVLVNTHHLAPLVHRHLAGRTQSPVVHVSEEPELLGSAGTLWANREFVAGEGMFLAIYADNFTNFELSRLVDAHRGGDAIATLSLFRAPRPSQCGIVQLENDRVVGYVEKPVEPKGDLANAGMYALSPRVLDEVGEPLPKDIGYDLLPKLVGQARAVILEDSYIIDIGTPAGLEHARAEWQRRRTA